MIRWFSLVLFFGILSLFFRIHFLYVLFYLSIILPLLSKYLLKFIFNRLRLDVSLEPKNIFHREVSRLNITVVNDTFLPIYWLEAISYLPERLIFPYKIGELIRIPSKGKVSLSYEIKGLKRGIYKLGPVILQTSDIISGEEFKNTFNLYERLTVYPKIVPILSGRIHSYQPIGELRSDDVAFEDPSLFRGTREYSYNDPIKRIHWKLSARTGTLQVKTYEPTIGAQSVIFLNLRYQDYLSFDRDYKVELAITLTASLATFLIRKKQEVGIVTNGGDMLIEDTEIAVQKIPPKRGEEHLIRILELLARVVPRRTDEFPPVIYSESLSFPRWINLIVISPRENDQLMKTLISINRRGTNVSLFTLIDYRGDRREEGIFVYEVPNEDKIKAL
ncbi:DUF58 domain-containing protein [bacterium]|nr:DUF58 domain-containing protein [bacterium]